LFPCISAFIPFFHVPVVASAKVNVVLLAQFPVSSESVCACGQMYIPALSVFGMYIVWFVPIPVAPEMLTAVFELVASIVSVLRSTVFVSNNPVNSSLFPYVVCVWIFWWRI